MSDMWMHQVLYIYLKIYPAFQPFTYNTIKSIVNVIASIAHYTVPGECSKRFTLHFLGRHIQSDTISISVGTYCNYNHQRNTLLCLSVLQTLLTNWLMILRYPGTLNIRRTLNNCMILFKKFDEH